MLTKRVGVRTDGLGLVAGLIVAFGFGSGFAAGRHADEGAGGHPVAAVEVPAIVVAGRGEVAVAPDRAVIWLGASVRDLTADAAQTKVNERMNAVIEAVKKLGIPAERIQTARAELTPVYERVRDNDERREPQVIAYRSSNSVRVEIDDLKQVGAAVDSAIKAGANQVNSIGFELKNDASARREALTKAVLDAREKAGTIAAVLGGTLGAVIEASEGGVVSPPRPYAGRGMVFSAAADSQSMPVESGQVQVMATVGIRYAFNKP